MTVYLYLGIQKILGIQKSILNSNSKLWDCTKIILPKLNSPLNTGLKCIRSVPSRIMTVCIFRSLFYKHTPLLCSHVRVLMFVKCYIYNFDGCDFCLSVATGQSHIIWIGWQQWQQLRIQMM